MALDKVKPSGGSGGKKGHSNMTHWSKTAVVKRSAKKRRRDEDKRTTLVVVEVAMKDADA